MLAYVGVPSISALGQDDVYAHKVAPQRLDALEREHAAALALKAEYRERKAQLLVELQALDALLDQRKATLTKGDLQKPRHSAGTIHTKILNGTDQTTASKRNDKVIQQSQMVRHKRACSSDRHAHVLSLEVGQVWRTTQRQLLDAGFSAVHRVQPVPVTDSRVLALEEALLTVHEKNASSRHWRGLISNMLTHADLWAQADNFSSNWIWIFEDDVMFDPFAVQHVLPRPMSSSVESDDGLEPWALVTDMQCILDDMERISTPLNNTLLYLGYDGSYLAHRLGLDRLTPVVVTGGHVVQPCIAMGTHAYGIRRAHAHRFWRKVRSKFYGEDGVSPTEFSHPYHRFQLDVNLRGFYMRQQRGSGWRKYKLNVSLDWPRCVDIPERLHDPQHTQRFNQRCALTPGCTTVNGLNQSIHLGGGGLFPENHTLRPSTLVHPAGR